MTVHKNMFEQPISARYVRFNPRAWRSLGQICMRVEIYLCQVYQGKFLTISNPGLLWCANSRWQLFNRVLPPYSNIYLFFCVTPSGCSRSTEQLPTTTITVSSEKDLSVTRDVASGTKVNAFTQQENPSFTSVVKGLYSKGFRTTETWTTWLLIAWLLLIKVVIE